MSNSCKRLINSSLHQLDSLGTNKAPLIRFDHEFNGSHLIKI